MRKWLTRIGLILLALVLAGGGLAIVKREEITRLLAVNTLFAPDRIVANFSDMRGAFLWVPLQGQAGEPPPQGVETRLPVGAEQWIIDRQITGLVVLRGGAVAHESYYLGTGPDDLRISWSVAKSFLSLLTGILVDEGRIDLSDPVEKYAPVLATSAYAGATVQDILQMESGVAFDEDYFDPDSDINRMGRVIALGGALDEFTAALDTRDRAPGEAMTYVSMDSHVLGMVLRGATGATIPVLMAERLTGPMGIGPAYFLTDGEGVAFVLGGLNMRTRDYARMGLLVSQGGRLDGQQIVPAHWVNVSTVPSAKTGAGQMKYGYQWWMPSDARAGEVMAQGVYGQFVYIDRARDVVIAVNAADRNFRATGVSKANIEMFRAIAAAQ
ncbi:CubicO group peptidase, beta-lactamase class C family [Jannaschia faecimaris]|uniref:CubicO group peptidase, beta-lactamase class C family n=1 Tax=Jannaschia faecimaris TaxID=1244108 RepID=A0A1H3LL75_9RHOB|nr:serine hydrolase [Jannaschia faecimaris]SDY65096.1 CubicO group peptidase, beta-lactamase class C family [Jannaschia faecimaris]